MTLKSVRPKKFLGQHFLKDQNVAKAIADTVDACPDIPVLEVGPGMGVLTQYILPKNRETKVVEIDFESVAYLREEYPQLEENIIEDDFLKMHLEHTFGGRPFVLTGNYPYNISSQIFFKMLDYRELIPCCTGMIQKEVAERLAAKPGCKAYGILSVLVQRPARPGTRTNCWRACRFPRTAASDQASGTAQCAGLHRPDQRRGAGNEGMRQPEAAVEVVERAF